MQMLLQKQHSLISYFKTLSDGPAGVELTTSCMAAHCSTNWVNGVLCKREEAASPHFSLYISFMFKPVVVGLRGDCKVVFFMYIVLLLCTVCSTVSYHITVTSVILWSHSVILDIGERHIAYEQLPSIKHCSSRCYDSTLGTCVE